MTEAAMQDESSDPVRVETLKEFLVKFGFQAEGVKELRDAAEAMKEVDAPSVRLACLDHAREMTPRADFAYSADSQDAWTANTIQTASLLAAFVINGAVPSKPN